MPAAGLACLAWFDSRRHSLNPSVERGLLCDVAVPGQCSGAWPRGPEGREGPGKALAGRPVALSARGGRLATSPENHYRVSLRGNLTSFSSPSERTGFIFSCL